MLSKFARISLVAILLIPLLITQPTDLSARSSSLPDHAGPQVSQPGTRPIHTTTAPQTTAGRASSPVGSVHSLLAPLTGSAAFAVDVYPDENLYYIPDTNTPGEWIYVGDVAGTAYYAGDFVGRDFSKIYVIDYYDKQLHTLDIAAGADTAIGAVNSCTPISDHGWTGATGSADGILYASSSNGSSSYLYTVSLSTGVATGIGQITNAPGIIDIAINAEGEMYGVDTVNDNLVQINPSTGTGTVIGSIGFNADYAQGMDFDEASGVLYLAAYDADAFQGELRIANTTTGNSVLVGQFPEGAEVGALAFTPPTTPLLHNPGFESGWNYWYTESYPALSSTYSHSGSWSVRMDGEECWAWQPVYIPGDALEVSMGYWLTGISADSEWDNDILCGSLWDLTRQTEYVDVCYGLTYFYSHPGVWKFRTDRLDASQLASVRGKWVLFALRLTQDWNPPYHDASTAYVDDAFLYVTRPIYDHHVFLPLTIR